MRRQNAAAQRRTASASQTGAPLRRIGNAAQRLNAAGETFEKRNNGVAQTKNLKRVATAAQRRNNAAAQKNTPNNGPQRNPQAAQRSNN